jgi:hypothetical protein
MSASGFISFISAPLAIIILPAGVQETLGSFKFYSYGDVVNIPFFKYSSISFLPDN